MTNLSRMKKGSVVKVHSFDSKLNIKSTFVAMGILPGDTITIVSESFLGSPMTIKRTDGHTVALRKAEASQINVEQSK